MSTTTTQQPVERLYSCNNIECDWSGPDSQVVKDDIAKEDWFCPRCHETTQEYVPMREYENLHGFFLEAVGLASMTAQGDHKLRLEEMLRRARAEILVDP